LNPTEALLLFDIEFKQDVFILLGIVYFALLLYWLVSLKDWIFTRFYARATERAWIIFSVVAGLAFAGVAGSDWGLASAGTALSIGLCMSLAMIDSTAAACLLASSLYLRPWELLNNDAYLSILPRFSIVLCFAHLALHFAKRKRLSFEWNKLSLLLVAFTGWVLVSTLFAPDPSASQSEFFDGFLKSILLYFILIQMVRTKAALRTLMVTLLLSFLFVGSISLYQTFKMSAALAEADNRLKGFGAFTNSNDIAALMVFILPFSAMICLRKWEDPIMRLLGASLSIVALAAIILSRSRGALMGVFAIVGVYLLIRIGKRAIIPLAVAGCLLALPAMIVISNRSSEDLEGSSAGRKTYLKAGIRMGFLNPVFGVGFNAFPEMLQRYSTESLEESKQMTAHNSWVLVFAETGPMGLILFTASFIMCMMLAWQIYATEPEFLLALVGYGVSIFFLSHSYLIYPYLLYSLVHIANKLKKVQVAA
jgi:O-antigen ligase